ncbi:hypothetical protein B4U80_06165 [Leptotrombidium deliense]|uniref:Integrase catalytic domain-containing protein n=1 Tax=Leptotrombidium deliense TaxID=299467 RepID=A0A443RSM7_9ACAR|nr:hypothetical protein B4U80_06165 [Leptotrombidium deliense]
MIPYEKENEGFKYLLTCIDVFSKYSWGIPIKNKKAEDVIEGFNIIFKQRIPNKLQTDLGKEFYNSKFAKLMKENNINHFSTNSPLKASVVERFNRTLKEKMWKVFSQNNNHEWISIIDDLIYNYNNSFHRSIKMTPIEASIGKNEEKVRFSLYSNVSKMKVAKFNIGDKDMNKITRQKYLKFVK